MAHLDQQIFCKKVKELFPEYFTNVRVLDIGSLDINGSNHYLFDKYTYIGVDIGMGKNVNIISKGHEYKPLDNKPYDIVISTECFEHDIHWQETINNITDNLVRSGGMFLFTCATTGRPEHGTRRSMPIDSPFTIDIIDKNWQDYYLNLTEDDIRMALDLDFKYKYYHFYIGKESHDLYFWGIKL
jgi:hypothetical protein